MNDFRCVVMAAQVKKDNTWVGETAKAQRVGYGETTLVMTVPEEEYVELMAVFHS